MEDYVLDCLLLLARLSLYCKLQVARQTDS